jgi:chloramphenicol-sensitive protein RarD
MSVSTQTTRGFLAALTAFFIWGLLPVYLKALQHVGALEIMVHRAVWCCVFVMLWLALSKALPEVRTALRVPSTRWRLMLSATLVTINWYLYVWAVNSGHVVEASLGYFINPLVNVLLGVLVLRERLNSIQWIAVGSAAVGVLWLTWTTGRLPWIALALAFTFGSYGLIRKTVAVHAVAGLGTETLLLLPLGLTLMIWMGVNGTGGFLHVSLATDVLLVLGGVVTAVPLALFAYGARLIPYSTVGLLQYLGPTLQLMLGVWLYNEPFPQTRLIGFAFIWAALAIYAADGLWRSRRQRV